MASSGDAMARTRTIFAAACAAMAFAAAAQAQAQETAPAEDARAALDSIPAIVAEMSARLQPLADSIGVDVSDLMVDVAPMMRAAFPVPPDGPEKWAFSFNFSNTNSVTDNGSAPEGRKTVLADAQACAALYPLGGPVVHFRRIRRDGLIGHQCIMRAYEDSMGLLISETYAEGVDRHMSASYVAAATVENDADAARALFEPVLESNIGLAVELADLALEAAIKAVPGGGD